MIEPTLFPGDPVSVLRLSLLHADIVALCILTRSTAGGGLLSPGALQSCEFWRTAFMLCLLLMWAPEFLRPLQGASASACSGGRILCTKAKSPTESFHHAAPLYGKISSLDTRTIEIAREVKDEHQSYSTPLRIHVVP